MKKKPAVIYTKDYITKIALSILKHEYKVEAWRQNNVRAVRGRTFVGRKGVSDLVGFTLDRGVMVMAEVKTLTDKFSTDQIELLTALHNAGGVALVAMQEDLKVVVKPFIQVINKDKS